MWLETPSPAPSPINVNVTVSIPPITVPPDAALDNYTLALANYTRDLAIGTGFLVLFTILLAVIGWRALRWQRREIRNTEAQLGVAQAGLQATQDQLRLAHEEFERARRQARPVLDFDIGERTQPTGIVKYIHGSDPAHEIQVWARTPGGYFAGTVGTLTPSMPTFAFQHPGIPPLQGILEEQWPFPPGPSPR